MNETKSSAPMTIRLDADTKGRMKRTAARLRLTSSAIIRLGLLKALPEMERGNFRMPSTPASE